MKNILLLIVLTLVSCGRKDGNLKIYSREKYDYVSPLKDGGLRKTIKGTKMGVIGKNEEEILPNIYDKIDFSNNEIISVKDHKFQMWSLKGKKIFEKEYDEFRVLDKNRYFVEIGGKHMMIDKNGHKISLFDYDEVLPFEDGKYLVMKNGKYGLVNYSGKEIVTPKYLYMHKYSNGVALVMGENNKIGFVDENGKEIVSPKYDYIDDFKGKTSLLVNNKKFGIIDRRGELLLPLQDEVIISLGNDLYGIKKSGKYYIENINNGIVLGGSFDSIGEERDGLIPVGNEGKYGYIDSSGNEIIPLKYTELGVEENGLIVVKDEKSGKFGIMDLDGEFVVSPRFTYVVKRLDGYFIVGNDEFKEGVIDYNGEMVVPLEYENLEFKSKHLLTGEKNDRVSLIKLNEDSSDELDLNLQDVVEFDDNEVIVENEKEIKIYNLR